jgi:hypothetical protein
MKEADDAHKLGHTEVAFEQYKKVAAIHEKRKEPLQKMAQIKFDNNQYGPAIQYAQEVMRLEPSDQLANSIVAVAGLRLSATSLGVLRRENQLSGSVKSEATGLADVLRQNLGVEEIVPPVQAKKTKRKSVVTTTSSTPNKKATGSADKSGGDPFGALK